MKANIKYRIDQSERRLVRFVITVVLTTLLLGILVMSSGCVMLGDAMTHVPTVGTGQWQTHNVRCMK